MFKVDKSPDGVTVPIPIAGGGGNPLGMGRKRTFIGIRGSATNDGGVGMLQALGGLFMDEAGKSLGSGGGRLRRLASADCRLRPPKRRDRGNDHAFGSRIKRLAAAAARENGVDYSMYPGAGAACDLGFALLSACGVKLHPGIDDIMLRISKAGRAFQEASLAGRIDEPCGRASGMTQDRHCA